MTIKNQLWISNFIIILITIFLLIMVSNLIISLSQNHQNILGIPPPPNDDSLKGRDSLKRELHRAVMTVSREVNENAENLEDQEYLQKLDNLLNSFNSGIIIQKNGKMIYFSPFLQSFNLEESVINSQSQSLSDKETVSLSDTLYLEKIDFRFPDQSEGRALILNDITSVLEELKQFRYSVFIILILFLLVIIIINTIVTYLLSRNIVKPLTRLENATLQIRKGNYNFKLNTTAKNEIGDLFRTFEETRKQLKETEKIKKKYENNRNELISNISHDLKTPITTIKGYIEGIIDGIPSSKEKMDKYLKTIYQNTINMESLINELFLLSKLELKELPSNFTPINIKAYLTDCFEELKFYLAEKEIELKFEADYPEKELIYVDREELKRVILNIINNAVNYKAKTNSLIKIILTEKAKVAQVEIQDNGQGIPEKSLKNIFERFYKADQSRATSFNGTGLGLYIAKKIIINHGGRIWAKSKQGQGTSIFFTLEKVHNFPKIKNEETDHEKNIDH
jgi:histidine kinase